jgi:UDP-glucose:(heptosyl)LPS alpha-1,3-glucosyltransferase
VRIALVRQRYNPYGGAERFIERARAALERRGAEVTVIARGWDDGRHARRVLRVDPPYLGSVWRDAGFARAARAAWERGRFDLVQSHERIPGCDIYRAGDGVHRRWLEIRRAAASPGERMGIALNPYHRYVCAAERAMFRHPRLRAVICNSKMVRDEIRETFGVAPEKLHVVYNGVDLAHFHPGERARLRGAARAELGVAADETLFVFIGSGFARKGLDAAIAALAQCAREPYRLAAAGRDREQSRFASQAESAGIAARVQFLGGREDVRPLYAAADCFILPTRYDPFPNTVLEALAMGVPVIAGRRSGAAELLREGEAGWVCEPGDAGRLARLMREAAAAARGAHTGAAARSLAERFGIDRMAEKLNELYSALSGTKGSSLR